MPAASRVTDTAMTPADAHGCPACPHPCNGPGTVGSPNILINGLPAMRVGDSGIHMVCCGPNMWKVGSGSATVTFNDLPAARMGDTTIHCGGVGNLIKGSPTVMVGG